MIIATTQTIIHKDTTLNSLEIIKLIKKAASYKANLIHFPECALSGYAKQQIQDWSHINWDILNIELQKVQQACLKYNIHAAIGSNFLFCQNQRPRNSILWIDNKGKMSSRYDKRFCSHSEISDWYSPGKKPLTRVINGIKFGFILCIEVNFPELFMEYESLGVDCILMSSYSDSSMFAIQAQGHAACNNYWLSLSIPQNVSSKQSSVFIGPDGSIISTCKPNQSDLIINSIDPNLDKWDIPCNKARPWRRLARLGDIYK